jgi:hypothetical protein
MPAITVKPSASVLVHSDLRRRTAFLSSACLFSPDTLLTSATRKLIVIALFALGAAGGIQAQTLNVRLAVVSTSPARLRIAAEFSKPTDVISFPNAYGSALGLAERIENVVGSDVSGRTIVARKLAPGEFQLAEKIDKITYEVNLSEAIPPAQHSHVSSLTPERGLLMLSDLLPRSMKGPGAFSSAQIQLNLPAGWSAESNTQKKTSSTHFSDEPDKAVFLIGPQLQRRARRIGAKDFSVVMSGDWQISDKDVLKVAGRIVQEYSKLTGFELKRDAVLLLAPFPVAAPPARWTAETRGNAVVLLLGNQGNSRETKARLGIALAHEAFHLWVPNSLKLQGDYDWFFEGFTVYQALRMDLRLQLISFHEYLDTIARVYDSYMSSPERDNFSLIQAAERRWTTSTSVVYDKAMLVAFLYDLRLRAGSNCKTSVADAYRQLFQRDLTRQADANETIIKVLNELIGQQSFARDYIDGVGVIDLDAALSPYGINVSHRDSGTKFSAEHATKEQRKVLECLARN